MGIAQLTVKTVPEFIEEVSKLEKRWSSNKDESSGLWFRGHGKSWWPLLPRLYRDLKPAEDARELDDEIREDFIKRAPSLTASRPENAWEWYFLMQHYGAPTRLLDWTEGALIGLFFAVSKNRGYHDAAVWVLDPWLLNKRAVGKVEVIPTGSPGLTRADRERYSPWLPDRFDSKILQRKLPAAVYPNHIDRRIVAQRSCFTIHGTRMRSLEEMLVKKEDRLAKIVIPSYKVYDVADELETCGLNEATVFPDLEGLGRDVSAWRQSIQQETPHTNVYTQLAPSKIPKAGLGVFAIKKIKKGTLLFPGDNDEIVWVEKSALPKTPKPVRGLYRFAVIKDGRYGCPPSFNRLTMAWYLNHSERPNVKCTRDYDFIALKDIGIGHELTVDYRTYNDPEALAF
ncbi:MAG: FRG domain-containing protein [Candidatus Acidiferrales bacterium]